MDHIVPPLGQTVQRAIIHVLITSETCNFRRLAINNRSWSPGHVTCHHSGVEFEPVLSRTSIRYNLNAYGNSAE